MVYGLLFSRDNNFFLKKKNILSIIQILIAEKHFSSIGFVTKKIRLF